MSTPAPTSSDTRDRTSRTTSSGEAPSGLAPVVDQRYPMGWSRSDGRMHSERHGQARGDRVQRLFENFDGRWTSGSGEGFTLWLRRRCRC